MASATTYGRSRPRKGRYAGRTRLIRDVLGALVTLRRGRWTIVELADELGAHWRSTYRLIAALRSAGITVEVSREGKRGGGHGSPAAYYQIPAEPLRKLLRL